MRRPLRRRASLAVSWQLCQGNDTTTVFGDLVRSHFDRLRSPLQTLKPLAPQGLALAVQTISKNGSSEIRTQDQSVKSQLDIAETPCCARAQETTPKHSPNKSVRLVRPSWQTSGQICPPFEEMGEIKQPLLDLRLPRSATVHRASEGQARENAQSLIHSLINPPLRAYTEEGYWMLL